VGASSAGAAEGKQRETQPLVIDLTGSEYQTPTSLDEESQTRTSRSRKPYTHQTSEEKKYNKQSHARALQERLRSNELLTGVWSRDQRFQVLYAQNETPSSTGPSTSVAHKEYEYVNTINHVIAGLTPWIPRLEHQLIVWSYFTESTPVLTGNLTVDLRVREHADGDDDLRVRCHANMPMAMIFTAGVQLHSSF
jgi:hypothetical protein